MTMDKFISLEALDARIKVLEDSLIKKTSKKVCPEVIMPTELLSMLNLSDYFKLTQRLSQICSEMETGESITALLTGNLYLTLIKDGSNSIYGRFDGDVTELDEKDGNAADCLYRNGALICGFSIEFATLPDADNELTLYYTTITSYVPGSDNEDEQ